MLLSRQTNSGLFNSVFSKMFYFKDLTVDESHCNIDPSFSFDSLDDKTKKLLYMLKRFKNVECRPTLSGDVRYHLISHECRGDQLVKIEQIRKFIEDHGYLDCNFNEFIWFCTQKLPNIDRPMRGYGVVTFGVVAKMGRIENHPMISKMRDVSNPLGDPQWHATDQAFSRSTYALAIEKI